MTDPAATFRLAAYQLVRKDGSLGLMVGRASIRYELGLGVGDPLPDNGVSEDCVWERVPGGMTFEEIEAWHKEYGYGSIKDLTTRKD